MIQVKFEAQGQETSRRNFDPGEQVRIGVHTQDFLGNLGFFGFARNVLIQVIGQTPVVYADVTTDPLGDAWADVTMPTSSGPASVVVHVDYGLGKGDDANIPIQIGSGAPAVYNPPVQSVFPIIDHAGNVISGAVDVIGQGVQVVGTGVQAVGNTAQGVSDLGKYLPYIALGGIILLAVVMVPSAKKRIEG